MSREYIMSLRPVNRKRILEVNRAKSVRDTILGETLVPLQRQILSVNGTEWTVGDDT